MNINRKFKGRRVRDNKGYLRSNSSNHTPMKKIDGGDITMEGVDFPVIAMPLDDFGNPMGMKFMKPGENFNFEGASSTVEVPVFKKGGRYLKKYQNAGTINNQIIPSVSVDLEGFTPEFDPRQQALFDIEADLEEMELDDQIAENEEFLKSFNTQDFGAEELNFDALIQAKEQELNALSYDNNTELVQNKNTSPVNVSPITENRSNQFFNPYGGFDMQTSAFLFGENVAKGGDPATAVGSGLKLVTSLGRNITSGIGFQKRSQEALQEAQKKKREGLIGNTTALGQDGGEFSDRELKEINDTTGIQFTSEGANKLFEKVQPVTRNPKKKMELDLGKFKDVGYFDVSMNGSQFVVNPSAKNFRNAQAFKDDLRYLMKLNPDAKFDGAGDLRHYVPNKDRRPQNFEEGGDIDVMTLTGNAATGTDDGMANVELEVNEYYKVPGGMPVKVLGDTHENGGEEMNLEDGTQVISDHLKLTKAQAQMLSKDYDFKVSTKDTYAKALDKFNNKSGLNDLIQEETQIIQSIKDEKIKAAEKGSDESTSNINLEFLSSKLNDISEAKKPLEALSATVFDKIFELQEAEKEVQNPKRQFQVGGKIYTEDQVIRIADKLGVKKDKAFAIMEQMMYGGSLPKAQTGITVGENPNTFDTELTEQPFTNQGRRIAGTVNDENFIQTMLNLQTEFPDEFAEVYDVKANAQGEVKSIDLKAGKTNKDFQQGMQNRYNTLIEEINTKVDDPELKKKFIAQVENEMFTGEGFKKLDDIIGNFTASRRNFTLDELTNDVVEDVETDLDVVNTVDDGEINDRSGAFLLPDQSPLPPQGIIMPTKIKRRFGRLEPELLTPDEQLTEINRQVDAAMTQIDNLPSGQREAAIIQLQANAQSQANKVVSEVEKFNKSAIQNANSFNVRQGDREEEARAIDLLDFERRVQGAQANTEDDFRRFFNTVQERNVANFNLINSLNLLNENYENIDLTNQGIEVTNTSNLTPENILNNLEANQAFKLNRKNNKPQGRYGGRIKRRRKKKY